MFSHLISSGRSFTWTQSSLIHLSKTAFLLLRSPFSASWALLVPPHTHLPDQFRGAGWGSSTNSGPGACRKHFINWAISPSLHGYFCCFPSPLKDMNLICLLWPWDLLLWDLTQHQSRLGYHRCWEGRGQSLLEVRYRMILNTALRIVVLIREKTALLPMFWKTEANSSIFLHLGNALGSIIHGSTCWSSLWKWCQLFGKCVYTWVCFV